MTIPVGTTVTVRVPASSANLGPGFDCVGLALGVWDECTVTVAESGLLVEVEGSGADAVPRDESHLVYRTMVTAWQHLGVEAPAGVHLSTRNAVPHGRGLGSSATAIVMGVAAAQTLQPAFLRPVFRAVFTAPRPVAFLHPQAHQRAAAHRDRTQVRPGLQKCCAGMAT